MMFVFATPAASAEDEAELKGEVRITMNLAYASVTVNGEEYGGVTFERNGKVCVISNLAESMFPVTIALTPSEDGYKGLDLPFEWDGLKKTKKRVKGGWHVYKLAKKTVKFAKGKDAPKPKNPEKPTKPGKKPSKPAKPDEGEL